MQEAKENALAAELELLAAHWASTVRASLQAACSPISGKLRMREKIMPAANLGCGASKKLLTTFHASQRPAV